TDVDVAYVPANDIADELGSAKMMNMATLGALLARRPFLTLDQLMLTLDAHLPARKAHLLAANKLVIQKGYEAAVAVPA
ncbi:MAG: 2-oxoacid:acceptor oxidoreductase family protein, partial [Chloroflexi bacterium]|nr:2-oxoacid:acceptor oxidoreductase family protein [Chloroflexota bacterium]